MLEATYPQANKVTKNFSVRQVVVVVAVVVVVVVVVVVFLVVVLVVDKNCDMIGIFFVRYRKNVFWLVFRTW